MKNEQKKNNKNSMAIQNFFFTFCVCVLHTVLLFAKLFKSG